jgi:hypothetical protein
MTPGGPSSRGAMVVIRHDVDDAYVADYLRWHSFEHLPERLALPGFLVAQRWERIEGGGPRYLCVIDVDSPQSLDSPEYRARLDAPTEWTRQLMPHYRNVQRMLCETLADMGAGVTPLLLCMQFDLDEREVERITHKLEALMTRPPQARTVARVRLGRALDALTRRPSEESRLRGADDMGAFPYFLTACVLSSDALADIEEALDTTACEPSLYAFSYAL